MAEKKPAKKARANAKHDNTDLSSTLRSNVALEVLCGPSPSSLIQPPAITELPDAKKR